MDDVVVRVARALCAEAGFDYDDENDPMQSSNGDDNGQEYWRSLAETAIRAMLEGLERDLALTELSNIEGASADWLDGFRAAVVRLSAIKEAMESTNHG